MHWSVRPTFTLCTPWHLWLECAPNLLVYPHAPLHCSGVIRLARNQKQKCLLGFFFLLTRVFSRSASGLYRDRFGKKRLSKHTPAPNRANTRSRLRNGVYVKQCSDFLWPVVLRHTLSLSYTDKYDHWRSKGPCTERGGTIIVSDNWSHIEYTVAFWKWYIYHRAHQWKWGGGKNSLRHVSWRFRKRSCIDPRIHR